jgi:hypothetical protein
MDHWAFHIMPGEVPARTPKCAETHHVMEPERQLACEALAGLLSQPGPPLFNPRSCLAGII